MRSSNPGFSHRRPWLVALDIDPILVLARLDEIVGRLPAQPELGIGPASFSSLMAISGETAAWPFHTRESVWRATSNTFAASVTFRPSGSRQFSLMLRPGCGGLFIAMLAASAG